MMQNLKLDDLVVMKKQHPCGENKWQIVRYGADVKIKCLKCNRIVLMERQKFIRNVKKMLSES